MRTRAREGTKKGPAALAVFKPNKRAITTLGLDVWNEVLEGYVIAEAMTRETVEARRAENSLEEWAAPDLWDEWTDESRREFLGRVVREVLLTPAHRKPVPAPESARQMRCHAEGVDHGLTISPATSPTTKRPKPG